MIIRLAGYNRLYAEEGLSDEYRKLCGKDLGTYRSHLRDLERKFRILDDLGEHAVDSPNQFEKLKGSPFFAIRQVGPKNTRVLYLMKGKFGEIYLLCAFSEKSTDPASDYSAAVSRAARIARENGLM